MPNTSIYKKTKFNKKYLETAQKKEEILLILDQLNFSLIDIKKEIFKKDINIKKFIPLGIDGLYSVKGYYRITKTIHKLIP